MIYMLKDITLVAIHSDTIQIWPLHLFPICFVSAHVDILGIQLCFIQVPWRKLPSVGRSIGARAREDWSS